MINAINKVKAGSIDNYLLNLQNYENKELIINFSKRNNNEN